MTNNFKFCNEDFLPLFNYKPSYFYNQFGNIDFTEEVLDSMGEHPECGIEFRYSDVKKIRATFITFADATEELDVKCICVLFHGDRFDYHCYFYEVYEDGMLGCVETTNNERIVKYIGAGIDTDQCFEKLCAYFGESKYDSVTMLFYKESDDCFRVLDICPSEFDNRSRILLGSTPVIERKTCNNIDFLIFKSQDGSAYLAARADGDQNPIDAFFSDIDILKNY
jgi:hypothetical protein